MRKRLLVLVTTLFACTAQKEPAAVRTDSDVAEWAAVAGALTPGPDSSMMLDVDLSLVVQPGWHVYSLTQGAGGPTAMSVKVSPPYSVAGEITGPPAEKADDANFGIVTETYSREVFFKIPLRLASSASVSPPPVELKIRSQACSDKLCLPARTTTLTVTPRQGIT